MPTHDLAKPVSRGKFINKFYKSEKGLSALSL